VDTEVIRKLPGPTGHQGGINLTPELRHRLRQQLTESVDYRLSGVIGSPLRAFRLSHPVLEVNGGDKRFLERLTIASSQVATIGGEVTESPTGSNFHWDPHVPVGNLLDVSLLDVTVEKRISSKSTGTLFWTVSSSPATT
jgi:hypothetical protein